MCLDFALEIWCQGVRKDLQRCFENKSYVNMMGGQDKMWNNDLQVPYYSHTIMIISLTNASFKITYKRKKSTNFSFHTFHINLILLMF